MSIDTNNSRVYITEIGMYSCLGSDLNESVFNLRNGLSGLVFSKFAISQPTMDIQTMEQLMCGTIFKLF